MLSRFNPAWTVAVALCTAFISYAGITQAEIYKTVDENGNVIYTDQKPAPNAKPIDLPELNVAEPHRRLPTGPSDVDVEVPAAEPISIVSPTDQENIWGTGGTLDVQLSTATELRPGMNVIIYIDGEDFNAGRSLSVSIDGIERGEHTLRAEIQTGSGRVVTRSEQVTFHMKQYSTNNRR